MNITFSFTKNFLENDIKELFSSVGWVSSNKADKLVKCFENSSVVISAWDNDKLVGLTRALSDGVWQATIDCMLVHKDYHGLKIASKLLDMLKEECKDVLYLNVIPDEKKNVAFYEKNDFVLCEEGSILQVTHKNWF